MVTCQRTMAAAATLSGVGLHTGTPSTITFAPAPADTGYVIIRKDLPGEPQIHPRVEIVSQTVRGTTLRDKGVEVNTIEHILAAVSGLGIDNCYIELDTPEPPIMDGSSRPFVEALLAAGIKDIPGSERKSYRLKSPIVLRDGEKDIVAWPYPGLRISYFLQYDHPWLESQRVDVDLTPETFQKLVAPCRTFCMEHEVQWLREQGLAKGGTQENAVVIGKEGPVNTSLRHPHELALHKILDFIGDLALLGKRIEGHFVARRTGHEMNTRFVHAVKAQMQRENTGERGEGKLIIEAREIEQMLPHRYPMLLVDRVIDLEVGKRVVGIKNVSMNEQFFQGHFPGHPIMPGVLIVEAMAQCGGVLLMKSQPDAQEKVVLFMGIDNVKFRKPVYPGDQLRFELEVEKIRSRVARMHGRAFVGEDLVCEADLMSTIVERQ
ncbi:UDP-3-O-[3-hydroxymyristoyl] N-acetylglucosamine deacetylase [candidate division FCPU426 bacterium]|nr:UDP-3-O-[3-hydroxymyristoyl] N-acetylglucosamine deacetylase [candidate division FCPU426 bacterium]